MIKLMGQEGSTEFTALQESKTGLKQFKPGISTSPVSEDHIVIRANAFLGNLPVKDLDLVIFAKFGRNRN